MKKTRKTEYVKHRKTGEVLEVKNRHSNGKTISCWDADRFVRVVEATSVESHMLPREVTKARWEDVPSGSVEHDHSGLRVYVVCLTLAHAWQPVPSPYTRIMYRDGMVVVQRVMAYA